MALELFRAIFGGGKPQRPAVIPTDEILPVHDFDARPQVRDIIIGWTLRFDDILDGDKLNVALSRLLEIGDWRKLGGRLRQRVSLITRHQHVIRLSSWGTFLRGRILELAD